MRATLWQPDLAPQKYVNIQIRVLGMHITEVLDHCLFRRQETQVSFILIHRLVMPARVGKKVGFFPLHLLAKFCIQGL